MCGIATLISERLTRSQLIAWSCALVRNEERGGDNVGALLFQNDTVNCWRDEESGLSEKVLQQIWNNVKFGTPALILGHTRSTATGSPKDAHPAFSPKRTVWIVHNGVVHSEKFSIIKNDTFEWAKIIEESREVGLEKDIHATSTAAFVFLRNSRRLFLAVYDKPMYAKKLEGGILYSQTIATFLKPYEKTVFLDKDNKDKEKEWEKVENGHYQVDLFSGELIKLNKKLFEERSSRIVISGRRKKHEKNWWDITLGKGWWDR